MVSRQQIDDDSSSYAFDSTINAINAAYSIVNDIGLDQISNTDLISIAALYLQQKNLEERALLLALYNGDLDDSNSI